ncbi:MAG: CarD family transcriptional regulator [bacterium]
MAKKTLAFKKGDKVIHPFHGGGVVVDIVEKEHGDQTNEYFLINILNDTLSLYVPTESLDRVNIKKIESKDVLDSCLTLMRKNSFKLIPNPTPLENKVREKIKQGGLVALSEAIGLICKFKSKREKEGKITPLNKNLTDLLNHAKKLFISQLALIQDMQYTSAHSYLQEILEKNSSA